MENRSSVKVQSSAQCFTTAKERLMNYGFTANWLIIAENASNISSDQTIKGYSTAESTHLASIAQSPGYIGRHAFSK